MRMVICAVTTRYNSCIVRCGEAFFEFNTMLASAFGLLFSLDHSDYSFSCVGVQQTRGSFQQCSLKGSALYLNCINRAVVTPLHHGFFRCFIVIYTLLLMKKQSTPSKTIIFYKYHHDALSLI